MPLHDYNCEVCGKFEHLHRRVGEKLKTCPTCGSEVELLLSAANMQFIGEGFYSTDYAKDKGKTKPPKGDQ